MISKTEMTASILEAKRKKNLTWTQLAAATGLSEVYTTSACLGENVLSVEEASRLGALLELPEDTVDALTIPATKGEAAPTIPKEPLQYRFQEIIYVYGPTLKAIIEEKFGPGIMSAIDFTMSIDREPHPAGDRVAIKMSGKFLAYKKW